MLLSLNICVKWKAKTSRKFNALSYGKLFKQSQDSIVAVGEDGVVQVYSIPTMWTEEQNLTLQPIRSLETKCGPAAHILLRDVTRLSPCDMLVADTRGAVVLFCDGQILVRRCSLSGKSARVTALEVQETGFGNVHVVVGRDNGELTCFNTFTQLWKLRLKDRLKNNMQRTVSVTCVMATAIVTSSGNVGDYILVADSNSYLHIVENGEILSSLQANSVVTTMTVGNFLQAEDSDRLPKNATQITLGGMDGCIWIFVDFAIDLSSPYAKVGHPVTHLRKVTTLHNYVMAGHNGDSTVDLLICGGHFHSLKIFQHGKIIHTLSLSSWPVALCGLQDWMSLDSKSKADPDEDFILIGCQDSVVQCIAIT